MPSSDAARWPHDPATFFDRRREREFYKYYEPFCASHAEYGRPQILDLSKQDAASNHRPRSSPDTTLTSFCQLGALRLKVRRCLLLCFDTEFAYVLAEATQTLSLQSDDDHDDDDALWLGTTVLPRGLSLCEYTVNIPAANQGTNQYQSSRGDVHIINNLTDDMRFCDRPFVREGPKCRFYAGVPIITPTGASIGAFCALDDNPRDGLSDKEIAFMCQISRTIMDYLENVRAKSVFGRGSRMLTSLDSFFKTAPQATTHAQARSPVRRQYRSKPGKTVRTNSLHRSDSDDHKEVHLSTETPKSLPNDKDLSEVSKDTEAVTSNHTESSDVKDFGGASKTPPNPTSSLAVAEKSKEGIVMRNASNLDDDLDDTLDDSIEKTFQIAAELLQQASECDGIVFIDVQKRANAGRVSRRRRRRSQTGKPSDFTSTDTEFLSTDGGTLTDSDDFKSRNRQTKRYSILGQATSAQNPLTQQLTSHYPSSVIKYLMKRYRRGHVWNFDSNGTASATESASDITETSSDILGSASTDHTQTPQGNRPPRQGRTARETQMFQKLFPGVRAVSFVPLWDTGTEHIYAVALLASYSPLRVLSNHGDLSFVRAFCDVVMASVRRLESASEEQAKTQFISSISHELRSPLHGILGGVDLLQASGRPDKMILSQIERCSINLIDIIEHLLEYAKINNLSKQETLLPNSSTSAHKSIIDDALPDTGISLAELTEDVADAVFYSHSYAADDQVQPIEYIIDSSLAHHWRSDISVGAWKRLCMNILNNSLKHTTRGHIKVSLSLFSRSTDGDAAMLTVSDTGVGMSNDFLKNGLFQAFRQENSLTPGTGLGMSLVAKLVKSIGGAIEVRSEKHVGTTVKVIVPLQKSSSVSNGTAALPFQGIKASIYSANTSTDSPTTPNTHELQMDAIKRNCTTQGMEFTQQQPEVLFIFLADLLNLRAQKQSDLMASVKAMIVLCACSRAAACNAALKELKISGVHAACVTQPFGPNKIKQALQAYLSRDSVETLSIAQDGQNGMTQVVDRDISPSISTSRPRLASQLRSLSQRFVSKTSDSAITPVETPPADAASPLSVPLETPKEEAVLELASPNLLGRDDLQHKMSLLLVDDNDINLRILQMYAKQNNHPYKTATDGGKAVEAYKAAFTNENNENNETDKIYPEVIFMDINMPVMSGFDATRQIRSFERARGLRPAVVIALTGLGSREAQEQAASSGIDIFLTKPVRSKELTMVLRSIAAETAAARNGV